MKAGELHPCDLCGKGIIHTGVPLFYRVTVERMGVDVQAVRERRGLHDIFGGRASPALLEVFAPTGEVANRIGDEHCLRKRRPPPDWQEMVLGLARAEPLATEDA